MTIKEIMTKVCDDATTFPQGWNTELKDFFQKLGREHYERRQQNVWVLFVREPNAESDCAISVHRTVERARKAMEEDIEATMARVATGVHPDVELKRKGKNRAKYGDIVSWTITKEPLWA